MRCAPTTISQLRVTLLGLRHSFPDDLDIALVGPTGQAIKLMSDAAGGGANELSGVDLTFDDFAPGFLPDNGFIVSGSYRPSDYNGGEGDVFQPPGPPTNTVYATNLAAYFGTNPNGVWKLFVADDHGLNVGSLDGWILDFGHAEFVWPNLALSAPQMRPDGAFQMLLNGEVNKKYYLEASTDLKQWTIIQTNVLTTVSMILTDQTAPQFGYRYYRASGCRD